jgi:hypothetical protein
MMDKLLDILRSDPDYKNFTLDGQTIPIEDYLEVRPEFEDELKKYVKERRLSMILLAILLNYLKYFKDLKSLRFYSGEGLVTNSKKTT